MTIPARTTVRNARELVHWLARPEAGTAVTYHIGNLAADRAASPVLHALAETVLILAERGALSASQQLMRLSVGASTIYSVARKDHRKAPRSLMLSQIDAHSWRALEAIADRPVDQSATRAIREHLGCPEDHAADMMCLLLATGMVERGEGKGYQISAAGRRMLM